LGKDLLIVPILKPGIKTKKLYLPKGIWYSWWTAKKYAGDQWIEVPLTIETIPIFVRAGAFIPMVKAVNSTDDYSSQHLTIRFYPEPSGKFSRSAMYEDDGKTFGTYEKGEYELLTFSQKNNSHFEFSVKTPDHKYRIAKRKVTLQIMNENAPREIHFSLKKRKQINTLIVH
jgi:oligosaccharide 4-alpha-D-glucosyltransferase